MTETTTPGKELRVGDGWRYQCWKCNYKVGIDKPFPKECPGCGARGWWGHLVTPGITQNPNNVKEGAGDNKNYAVKVVGGIRTQNLFLSHDNDAVVCQPHENKGVYEPSHGQGRGRPRLTVPEDLIMELDGQGFSSRAMVEELAKHGVAGIGYKTIQRRLQRDLL